MKKIGLVLFFGLSQAAALHAAGTPFLAFSDLISGPNTGNSDNSQSGQVAGQDGAIVTVWGKNLGTSAGQITVGGVPARIYSWGNADHNAGPADLFSKHGMQVVSFQIPHGATSGPIQATASGGSSNTLPFTVRAGNMYYVKTSGNDSSGNGSWSAPWKTISSAVTKMMPGDTLYPCDGVQQTTQDGDRSTVNLEYGRPSNQLSSQSMPKALIAYPGAHVLIGNTAYGGSMSIYAGGGSGNFADDCMYWTLSKLSLIGNQTGAPLATGFRLIASYVTAPQGDQPTGAVTGFGSDLSVLGNEITNTGYAGGSKLYHPMYIQSSEDNSGPNRLPTETNREIAWNYMHDNAAYDGINIYREGNFSAYMTNQRIHDNVIINQNGRGMLLGEFMTGDQNYVYNNIIIKGGSGPAPSGSFAGDPAWAYVCVDIQAGAVGNPATTIHFYNNTLYGCGFGGGPADTGGMVSVQSYYPFDLDFRNNIVQSTGFPFLLSATSGGTITASKNIWFGSGGTVPAAFATGSVTGDPKLATPASGDVHLQSGSAAIDAGSNAAPVASVDFDNNPRPQGAAYDIGAIESGSGSTPPPPPPPSSGTCDLNGDSQTNVVDVQLMVNQAIGASTCTGDINRDGVCNVLDVQRDVNAALGGACVTN